jgi:hypothetical protein
MEARRLTMCIIGATIEPLHDKIFSDHRVLVVDVNTAQLLGQTLKIANQQQGYSHWREKSNAPVLYQA